MLFALIRAARPRQWVKNLFVGAPLIFARSLLDPPRLTRGAAAVLAFCLISSAVYLWNDVVDVNKDRLHPTKRLRPIASGELPIPIARNAAALLATVGLLSAWLLDPWMAGTAGLYLGLNAAYSLRLKHVPYVDVLVIAAGFLLRVLAGSLAVRVHPSRWLLLCTLLLACFLGFGKRAHELEIHGTSARGVLKDYRPERLRILLYLTAAATVAAYALYTLDPHTRLYFGTDRMVWTVPSTALGVLRFLQLSSQRKADSPTDQILRDPLFLANLAAWAVLVLIVIYFAP